MSVFVYKLVAPRTTFAQDMTARERAVMSEHVAYWSGLAARGAALVFGPVADPAGFWGLGVVRADSLEAARELTAADPAITSGVARCEIHPMPRAVVAPAVRDRPGPPSPPAERAGGAAPLHDWMRPA